MRGTSCGEVSAPEGFQVAEDVTFNVEETTEVQTITMEDEKTPDQPEEPDDPETPPTNPLNRKNLLPRYPRPAAAGLLCGWGRCSSWPCWVCASPSLCCGI